MKKIGIITINGNVNVGNRLQNYALQNTLECLGYEVDTIWFCNIKGYLKEKIKKPVFYFTNKRKYRFLKFSADYIKTKYYFKKSISSKYDFFVAGSDQIWNCYYPDFNENMLLLFSPQEKNVSYAASFGINNIPSDRLDLYKKGLSNFSKISVREDRGKKIVDEILSTTKAEVLIDPTMLLKKDSWEKIMKKPKNIDENKKYIIKYFLGNLSDEKDLEIRKLAESKNYNIVDYLDKNDDFYACGPSEFLYLIKNASLICTDSFHACVFSILFDKPFIVFDRDDNEEKISSRIETLLNKFKIENRRFENKITEDNLNSDYSKAFEILETERKKSIDFLKL